MRLYLAIFFLLTVGLFAGQLYQRHPDQDSIDREFDEIYRSKAEIIIGTRRPYAQDKARAGTFWLDTSSTTLYARWPDENGWRRITTSSP